MKDYRGVRYKFVYGLSCLDLNITLVIILWVICGCGVGGIGSSFLFAIEFKGFANPYPIAVNIKVNTIILESACLFFINFMILSPS